jgi:tRNA threonylcarbamoyladenosine modification (KEOPS) complex  Pcc1 subunit
MPKKRLSKKQEIEKARSTIVYRKDPALNYALILASCSAQAYKRSAITISETDRELRFEVKARDVTALMASTTSILRRLQVIEATKMWGRIPTHHPITPSRDSPLHLQHKKVYKGID